MNRIIVIPAVKKDVAFDNDLVKRIAGVMLIQRALDLACTIELKENIWVITDSQEIELLCQRQGISCYRDSMLKLKEDVIKNLEDIISGLPSSEHLMLLWPYCPLIKKDTILKAWGHYLKSGEHPTISVRKVKVDGMESPKGIIQLSDAKQYYRIMRAFILIPRKVISKGQESYHPYVIHQPYAEIASFHDWWVVEKLIERKRILFRVIGSNKIGMGHIYRSLTLAHEVTNHEVLFLCDSDSDVALNKIAGYDYYLKSCSKGEEIKNILDLHPDLVINDILNTQKEEILALQNANIKVVNFEDLGEGAQFADLVVNELYDQPQYSGDHVCWGHQYSFLRDEFVGAKVHSFRENVGNVLLTFGGSDPSNLTLRVLKKITNFSIQNKLNVNIVCGTGYLYKEELTFYLTQMNYSGFNCTFETGVISRIMETTEVAISSNGRTTYELAHMNIPAIILAHHPREHTHRFTVEENGFINLGVYDELQDKNKVVQHLEELVCNTSVRKSLYQSMESFNFLQNKDKVIQKILSLL